MSEKTALMSAPDAEYGEWWRCELRTGLVVYIGNCGCCGTWIAYDDDPPVTKGEWRDETPDE